MKLNLKTVTYFGREVTVPTFVNWLAVDSDGQLFGYEVEPQSNANFWQEVFFDSDVFICKVDLQDTDWKTTKVKV